MDRQAKRLLICASAGHFAVAILHFVMPFIGPLAYGYFGAPELTAMALKGSVVPPIATFGLALAFTALGFLGFSAAGIIHYLKIVRPLMWGIGIVYVLRGLLAFVQAYMMIRGYPLSLRDILFSVIALIIGLIQLSGLWKSRRQVSPPASQVPLK
jgi:hypothetical protein